MAFLDILNLPMINLESLRHQMFYPANSAGSPPHTPHTQHLYLSVGSKGCHILLSSSSELYFFFQLCCTSSLKHQTSFPLFTTIPQNPRTTGVVESLPGRRPAHGINPPPPATFALPIRQPTSSSGVLRFLWFAKRVNGLIHFVRVKSFSFTYTGMDGHFSSMSLNLLSFLKLFQIQNSQKNSKGCLVHRLSYITLLSFYIYQSKPQSQPKSERYPHHHIKSSNLF